MVTIVRDPTEGGHRGHDDQPQLEPGAEQETVGPQSLLEIHLAMIILHTGDNYLDSSLDTYDEKGGSEAGNLRVTRRKRFHGVKHFLVMILGHLTHGYIVLHIPAAQ